jgi:S-DNA-T family DNA segregation ATPase FtsK/SpoIIIE
MASSAAERKSRRRSRRGDLGPATGAPRGLARAIAGILTGLAGILFLCALLAPGAGFLTDGIRDLVAPVFGAVRFALPALLVAAGYHVARRDRGALLPVVIASLVALAAATGLVDIATDRGGLLGSALAGALTTLVTVPGAIATLAAACFAALLFLAEARVRAALTVIGDSLAGRLARTRGVELAARRRRVDEEEGEEEGEEEDEEEEPATRPVPAASPTEVPVSSTLAPAKAAPERVKGRIRRVPVTSRTADAWSVPPLELLDPNAPPPSGAELDHETNREIIEAKLASFNLAASVAGYHSGPTVTQYEITPDPTVKLSRIEGLADDLAMALAARSIRIEAPIPGKALVGIEIPNPVAAPVGLRAIFEEVDFEAMGSKLTFALGRGVAGEARAADLARMPHLLVAGATGSGKSVMINAILTSLLLRATPAELRLILVDPKRVELAAYEAIPHLLTPLVVEPERAKRALLWAVTEMERRYKALQVAKSRNITDYNETRADPADKLPMILIVIDEMADLMLREGKQIEEPIVRLAQKARAVGIHMLLATQRPSVNVVTGLIKANVPSRVAFGMASQIDSRTVLDAPGAEDLLGRGDMLYQPSDMPKPIRLQGVFVSDREIRAVTEAWRAQGEPAYLDEVDALPSAGAGNGDGEDEDEEQDELFAEAARVIAEHDRASASLLQRRLRIGYARAARLLDALEEAGIIGPADGSNARRVIGSYDED